MWQRLIERLCVGYAYVKCRTKTVLPILQYNSSSISLIVHSVTTTMALSLSGRQFLQAEEILYSARHASYEESLEAGVQCFLLAIDVSGSSLCQ